MNNNIVYKKRNHFIQVAIILFYFFICLSYFIVKCDDFLTYQKGSLEGSDFLSEILSSDEYVQRITCDMDGLDQIHLSLATFARENDSHLNVSLKDANGNELENWEIECKLLKDNSYFPFVLNNRLISSKNKDYFLHITSDAEKGRGITIYYNNIDGQTSGLSLNGQDMQGDLCYRLVYKSSYQMMLDRANGVHVRLIFLFLIIVFFMLFFMRFWKIEKKFLIIWLLLGIIYLFSMTLFRAPDEESHFYRAFEVSNFKLLSDTHNENGMAGSEMPFDGININDLEKNWQSFSDNSTELKTSNNLIFQYINGAEIYPPVSYIPQALGIFIARNLTTNIAVIAYAGRIMNWITITILLYIAIKVIPFGKEILSIIVLMPMNVHESISLAPDGMVVAISILMLAFVMQSKYENKQILNIWQLFILYFMAIFISLLKFVYFPIIFLYLLIPMEKFGKKKNKLIFIFAIIATAICLNFLWLVFCSVFFVGSSVSIKIPYLIHHIGNLLIVLARSIFIFGHHWILQMIGISLAELNVETIGFLILLYLCFVSNKIFKYCNMNNKEKDDFTVNILCFLIVISIFIMILMSLYIQWTSIYDNLVNGVQGRYFIPLLFPLYFSICNPSQIRIDKKQNDLSICELSFIICINFCACVALLFSCMKL